MRYDKAFYRGTYHTALMTTFAFDPTVFENVLLIALRSNGCRNIAVIADRDMLNRSFNDVGPARAAGLKYHLAKRKVTGSFHPKIVLQLGKDGGRLMVGSANLTGPGLVSNLEGVSSIEVTAEDRSAAPLLASALAYFEAHCEQTDLAMRRVIARARRGTPWLTDLEPAAEVFIEGTRTAFLTEFGPEEIGQGMARFIGSDEIEELVMVSPFWDASLAGVERFREMLGMPPVSLVVDRDEQDFDADAFRRLTAARLHSSADLPKIGERKLHAKLLVARGRAHDYVLSGSANASLAGLFGLHGGPGNAEACILRAEPPGSAIDRLGLGLCLANEMPLADIRMRRRAEGDGADLEAIIDGGSFSLDGTSLLWMPPAGRHPEGAILELHDRDGGAVYHGSPVLRGSGRVLELAPDMRQPRTASVRFSGGEVSVAAPIALLSDLERNARASNPTTVDRLLEEIEQSPDVDFEMLRLALLIEGDAHSASTTKNDGVTRSAPDKDAPDEETPQAYSAEDFKRILVDETTSVREDARHGPLGDLRDIINRRLGLFEQLGLDELDALSAVIKEPGKKKKSPPPPPPGRALPAVRQGGFHDAKLRASKLSEHVNRTCLLLREPAVNALSYGNAIRLRLLVMAVLREACPAGAVPGPDHALSAAAPSQSWVRMLGRLMAEVVKALSSGEAKDAPLDEETLEALALFQFVASLSSEVALHLGMTETVVRHLQEINGTMARAIHGRISGQEGPLGHLEKSMAALSSHYARLSPEMDLAMA